jgi:hypothetical protein
MFGIPSSMPARKAKPGEKPQFERFLEAVKAAEANRTDEGLAAIVRHVARPPGGPKAKPAAK